VTGVSTGIGWGITKILIQQGFRVFGSVRKTQDAERLSKEFGEKFVPLRFDVTDEAGVQAAARRVREQINGETLFGLVNNAGIAVSAPLIHQSTDDFRHQIEVNLVSVLIVTKAFLPLLGSDRSLRGNPGRIINISSVGGKVGGPFLGAYAASKHGLEGFSESLRRELMLYGIDGRWCINQKVGAIRLREAKSYAPLQLWGIPSWVIWLRAAQRTKACVVCVSSRRAESSLPKMVFRRNMVVSANERT
jgi:NAD(P)-dependent dehydrogenase (short-subunit alcohol dehydrogenase family)